MSIHGKTAVVIGASSGVGRATVKALMSGGARVTAVARGEAGLAALRAEVAGVAQTIAADAAEATTAERLLRELRPELVVLAVGSRPRMGPVDELTWDHFSEAWSADVKATFHLTKAALALPLAPGSTVVVVSSGAAIGGSPLSGGYAGAKRMQWLLAGYAQKVSDKRGLGLRFLAVLPNQLIPGSAIGDAASAAYGAWLGTSAADFMKRFKVPLDVDKVAAAIVAGLDGDVAPGATAIAVTGEGVTALP